jgi:hypothetical protein
MMNIERPIRQNKIAEPITGPALGTVEPIEMTVTLHVVHVSGDSPARDAQHVANWLVADNQNFTHAWDGVEFTVCPVHADPAECLTDCEAPDETYRAVFMTADVEDVA